MARRKGIGKKLRFEVFKRDGFKCQYCGKSAPDVILHVDHINPVANGGDGDILNLITSCEDCNLGKGARKLDDDSVLAKQKLQLEELNERRQQLEMMLKWREEMGSLEEMQVDAAEEAFHRHTTRWFSDFGKREAAKWIKKYGLGEVLDCIEISATQYFDGRSEKTAIESASKVFNYVPKIANVRLQSKSKPYLQDLIKLKWLAKKELSGCKDWQILKVLESAHVDGVGIDLLRTCINSCGDWHTFLVALEEETGVCYG